MTGFQSLLLPFRDNESQSKLTASLKELHFEKLVPWTLVPYWQTTFVLVRRRADAHAQPRLCLVTGLTEDAGESSRVMRSWFNKTPHQELVMFACQGMHASEGLQGGPTL